MIKKISALILIFNLCFLPVFTQTLKKSEKDSRYSKVKLTVKSINIGNKKKTEKPEPKKNYDRFDYDEAGRIVKIRSKDKGIIKISYDEYGRLKSRNESNIESQHFYYDKLGRNTKIEYRSKEKKNIVEFKYSTLEESYKLGYMNEKIEKSEHSFYKYEGRRLLEEKKVINGHTFIIKYRYNKKGYLSEIHYPSGLIVSYEYNDKNKIENVFVVRNKIRSEVLKYIKGKDSTSLQYGNGLNTEININKNKRTLNMKTGDIQDLEFRFNDKGLIDKVIDKKARRNKKEFYYDQYERLITAYGPWGKISYRYDSMDNLTKKIEKDCKLKLSYDKKSSKIKELIENDTNVIVKYDQLGRMTKYGSMTFSYNERGRLEKIIEKGKPVIELSYNYKNQRVIEKRGDIIEYYYIYDNQDRVLAKYDNMGNILKQYIYSKETPVGFVKDNKVYYYHYDLMNFPIMITDNTGKVVRKVQYKPYGEIISFKGELNDYLRFPGQYNIKETNLCYNLNRIYTPVLTRYLEPDPIVNVNNIYEYTSGNPVCFYDYCGQKINHYWGYMSLVDSAPGIMKTLSKLLKKLKWISIQVPVYFLDLRSECYKEGEYLYYKAGCITAVLGGVAVGIDFGRAFLGKINLVSIKDKYSIPDLKEAAGLVKWVGVSVVVVGGAQLGYIRFGNTKTGIISPGTGISVNISAALGWAWVNHQRKYCCD